MGVVNTLHSLEALPGAPMRNGAEAPFLKAMPGGDYSQSAAVSVPVEPSVIVGPDVAEVGSLYLT